MIAVDRLILRNAVDANNIQPILQTFDKSLTIKYDFEYPEDKLIKLSKEVKKIVDDKSKYPDWNQKDDIKAELKVDLIMILAEYKYPPVDRDEVYKEIFEQAENFKKHLGNR